MHAEPAVEAQARLVALHHYGFNRCVHGLVLLAWASEPDFRNIGLSRSTSTFIRDEVDQTQVADSLGARARLRDDVASRQGARTSCGTACGGSTASERAGSDECVGALRGRARSDRAAGIRRAEDPVRRARRRGRTASRMASGRAVDSPCAQRSCCPLSPHPARVAPWACRCLRRDVDGPIHRPRGSGRRPDGERVARNPGGPDCNPLPAKTRNSAHAGDCPHCGLKVRWRRLRQRGRAGSQSVASGTQIADAGAARQPRDPSRVPGSPTGLPGRRNRRLPGRVVPAPGLPTRHPRTRRTSGPYAGGRTARGRSAGAE